MNTSREKMAQLIAKQVEDIIERHGFSNSIKGHKKRNFIKEISLLAASDIFYALEVKELE